MLNRELESNPSSLGALNERTLWHKRMGNWRAATADVERTADLVPGQSIIRFQGAYLGVLAGDLAAYRRTCQTLLNDFSNSDNVEDLERACKAMLFVPGEFELSDLPLQQFEKLIKPDVPDNGPMYWACVTRAFIACHENKPELALEWLSKREVSPSAPQIFTYSMLVRAQAEFKLGRTEEAIAPFEEAKSLMPADLIQKLEGTFDDKQLLASNTVHGDWLILSILLRQTQAMLDGQP